MGLPDLGRVGEGALLDDRAGRHGRDRGDLAFEAEAIGGAVAEGQRQHEGHQRVLVGDEGLVHLDEEVAPVGRPRDAQPHAPIGLRQEARPQEDARPPEPRALDLDRAAREPAVPRARRGR